jgi:Mn2+/Fe2+ NRAMP family transporter
MLFAQTAGRAPGVQAARRKLLSARWTYILGILGPGLVAAAAGDDGGGIATYASIGAKYGYDLCWLMVYITLSVFIVQEMCARMGAVTGKGLSALIRDEYGIHWTVFAVVCILVANGATTVSEFVGLAAALELFGVSKYLSVPIFAVAIWWMVVKGSYHRVERVLLLLTLPFLSYFVAAVRAHPDWNAVVHHSLVPTFHTDPTYIMLFVATIGTTITPYMQIIQQSTVVEKAITVKTYRHEWWDVLTGVLLANFISLAIIVATAATLFKVGVHDIGSAADAARALEPVAGHYAYMLFGIGLLGASTLAAAVLPLSTAFSYAESFGLKAGVHYEFREARAFYLMFTALIVIGAGVTLIPGLDLVRVLVLVQAVNGVLLPALLVFMTLLSSNKRLMGEHRTSGLKLWAAWATTIIVGLFAAWLLVVSLAPMFGVKLPGG